LAKHWQVHPNTITRDYEQWIELGFAKLRPNPFKASAKIVIFAWSKVWDDTVWTDPKEVASMLPDLREAFGQKSRGGRMHATQKDRTDATCSMAAPLYEKSESEMVKEKLAAAGTESKFSDAQIPRKPASDSPSNGAIPPGPSPGSAHHRDKDTVDGLQEMMALLAGYQLRAQPKQVQVLIAAGLGEGFSLDGVFAFVEDKLQQKKKQNDPVYSVQLLIAAIRDPLDQHRWTARGHRCRTYFTQQPTDTSPFTVEELRDHLSEGAERLRAALGFDEIAYEVGLLASNSEMHFRDLEALEMCLVRCEDNIVVRARSLQTEVDVMEMRKEIDAALKPYQGKMTLEQLTSLEHQYFGRRMFERHSLSRLSLFYLRPPSRAAA
jgi:hypothetical protein